MAVLSRPEIENAMKERGLIITPLLNPSEQIGEASVDVRLGNEFILLRKRNLDAIDIKRRDGLRSRIAAYQEKVRIEYQEALILHPNQLVLGATLEYIRLPDNIGCNVLGRSSWGRLGLVIETASAVAPTFRGCVTLELINVGEVPLVLYPGVSIAQLVFHFVTTAVDYDGRYVCPTGPQFSKVYDDVDLDFWCPEPPVGGQPARS